MDIAYSFGINGGKTEDWNPNTTTYSSSFIGKCDVCGKDANVLYYSNSNLVATRCYEHPYDFYKPTVTLTSDYNYRCPDCHGEFNMPASETQTGTVFSFKCPFCGRGMAGL